MGPPVSGKLRCCRPAAERCAPQLRAVGTQHYPAFRPNLGLSSQLGGPAEAAGQPTVWRRGMRQLGTAGGGGRRRGAVAADPARLLRGRGPAHRPRTGVRAPGHAQCRDARRMRPADRRRRHGSAVPCLAADPRFRLLAGGVPAAPGPDRSRGHLGRAGAQRPALARSARPDAVFRLAPELPGGLGRPRPTRRHGRAARATST